MRDPVSYDVRRSVGPWLGFVLALPIPVLALASSAPLWIDVVALAAPLLWAVILGASARVSHLGALETDRVRAEALSAGLAHADERTALRTQAHSERAERDRLESLHALMSAELDLAQRVHRSLLPEDVTTPDVEVVVRQIPCSFVGGDYLHASFPAPHVLYLCVGDVSGHGVSAALVVSRIHGVVQRWVLARRAPEQILAELQRSAARIVEHTPLFLTFGVFRIDLLAERVDYATAGHPAQLLMRADGSVERLTSGNGILGTSEPDVLGPIRPASAPFHRGDTMVLFTDGLFEVTPRAGGEMLGESGLREGLERLSNRRPSVIASEILRSVTDFGRVGPFEDDVSLMIARFLARPRTPIDGRERRPR